MHIPLLHELVIIFGLAIGVLLLFHALRLPAVVGYLATGALCGPYGLGLVADVHGVEVLAEIGVVLLLFTIGMELSIRELVRLGKTVLLVGAAQVVLTIALVAGVCMALGVPFNHSVFFGFLASLSSTAIVLSLQQERAETESPQGRVALAVLIFQDLAIVPLMLAVPLLAGRAEGGVSLTSLGLKTAGMLCVVFFLARWGGPWLFRRVVRTRSRELLTLTALALCFAVGVLTEAVGLSISLGAFLAGLVVSESEYSLSALEDVLPLRNVFASLFFVSVGMLLDVGYLGAHLPSVLAATAALLLLKGLVVALLARLAGYPSRVGALSGLALCQVGEFSFVLAGAGLALGLLEPHQYQFFLAAAVLSMVATPFLINYSAAMVDRLARLPLGWAARLARREEERSDAEEDGPRDHLLIVGFGFGGRALARAARAAGIDYQVVEQNPDTVSAMRAKGEPIRHGDAGSRHVLGHAGAQHARVLAIMTPDPAGVRRIVAAAREVNPTLHILARTRFVSEIEPLAALGADEVVPEEFETSVEIFSRVLARYLVPVERILGMAAEVRAKGYRVLRGDDPMARAEGKIRADLAGVDVCAFTLEPGAPLDGKSPRAAALRKAHGVTLVAVRRDGELHANPDADFVLGPGDVAYVFGERAVLAARRDLFAAPGASPEGGADAGEKNASSPQTP